MTTPVAMLRQWIANAYYDHNYAELRRITEELLEDRARLDYLDALRIRAIKRQEAVNAKSLNQPCGQVQHWEAFNMNIGPDSKPVREQIDAERIG